MGITLSREKAKLLKKQRKEELETIKHKFDYRENK
jgi:hypothetical protein